MSIIRQIQSIERQIETAAAAAGRQRSEIRLVAVSKTRDATEVRAARAAGVTDFGENYLQEALPKLAALADIGIVWHFIGRIQSNKTQAIATHFDWVQTLDRVRIADRLSRQRPAERGPLNVLIQVNIDREPHKAGVHPEALAELAAAVRALPRLRLRGLMAIPRPAAHGAGREALAQTAALFRRLQPAPSTAAPSTDSWDTLSMGMTDDFQPAIAEGATMVRIGTGIFGRRPAP